MTSSVQDSRITRPGVAERESSLGVFGSRCPNATSRGASRRSSTWHRLQGRRLRNAQVELGTTDVTDIDRVPLPPNLERLVQQIRRRIGSTVEPTVRSD